MSSIQYTQTDSIFNYVDLCCGVGIVWLTTTQTQVAGHFTFWISVSLRLSLNPKFRLSKIRIFVELLAHPLETPWPKWMATPECAQVCAVHMRPQSTALGDAKENRNGRRLSSYRRKSQNWYYVTHFLAHPVDPVTNGSKHMRHLDRGEIKLFCLCCLYASIFNSF